MGAAVGKPSGGGIKDINMTPLIDIVLVVLIIMMVNIPIQVEEMGIKLPSTEPPPPSSQDKPDQLVVALYEDGSLALNRRAMTEEILFSEVTRRLRPMAKKRVFVDAFPTTPYGRVVDMVDLAREAGAAEVGLARLKEDGPAEPTSVHPGTMPKGVIIGSPQVRGAITEKKADGVIQQHKAKLMGCYAQGLARDRDLSGRLSLRFGIGPQGEHLEEPEIMRGGTLEDEGVRACVLELMGTFTFPPLGGPDKTAAVLYPVLFSPGK